MSELDAETLAYHERQKEPYRSTVAFAEFIRPWIKTPQHVLDLGCGAGRATAYLLTMFPDCVFDGFDRSEELIEEAKLLEVEPRLWFACRDFTVDMTGNHADGVVSLQTLHTLPDYTPALEQICTKISPDWMAFSALIYPGKIECRIAVEEPDRPRSSFYNIISLTRMDEVLAARSYKRVAFQPFTIDIDLPPMRDPNIMQSYTVRLDGRRAIMSGPLLLPWAFVAYERVT